MNYNKKVSEYIETAPAGQQESLETIRKLIHESVPGVSEEIKWGFPVFAKTRDFAYLRFAKNHTTLGFYNIDKITDNENVLEGSGNTLRHVKIKSLKDINKELFAKWLKAVAV